MVGIDFKVSEMTPEMARSLSNKSFYNGFRLGLKDIGGELEETAQEGIRNPPKSGRFYVLKGGRLHQASAPGEYPAERTGDLRKSIGTKVSGLQLRFGAEEEYAKFLQQADSPLKTQSTGTKIKARPFLTLSHRSNAPGFQPIMRDRVLNTIQKG